MLCLHPPIFPQTSAHCQRQPFGSLLGIGILADVMQGLYPMGGVVADALLKAPLLRRAVNWMGVRPASSATIVQMFADGLKVHE